MVSSRDKLFNIQVFTRVLCTPCRASVTSVQTPDAEAACLPAAAGFAKSMPADEAAASAGDIFVGTPDYASFRCLSGQRQGLGDDLESMGYSLLEMYLGEVWAAPVAGCPRLAKSQCEMHVGLDPVQPYGHSCSPPSPLIAELPATSILLYPCRVPALERDI